jgi:hypothetical protein
MSLIIRSHLERHQPSQQRRRIELADNGFDIAQTARQWVHL